MKNLPGNRAISKYIPKSILQNPMTIPLNINMILRPTLSTIIHATIVARTIAPATERDTSLASLIPINQREWGIV